MANNSLNVNWQTKWLRLQKKLPVTDCKVLRHRQPNKKSEFQSEMTLRSIGRP